jgi:hypothetical protein
MTFFPENNETGNNEKFLSVTSLTCTGMVHFYSLSSVTSLLQKTVCLIALPWSGFAQNVFETLCTQKFLLKNT